MNVLRLLPRRRTPLLDVAIERLIFEPDSYWPDDSYFHRRNRQKLARAWNAMPELHDKGRDEIRDIFRHILIQRRSCRPTTLYVMSYGSSGSHFVGSLLDGLPNFVTTDEIYFPPGLLQAAKESTDPDDRLVVDFINYFHTGTVDPALAQRTVVNIGHVRRDTPPDLLRELDPAGRFLLLLRNPYDLAVSRAFRKPDYRQQVAPDMSDDEYLARQVSGTFSFLSFAATQRWDRVVRYEEVKANPIAVIGDLLREMGMALDVDAFAEVVEQYDARRAQERAEAARIGNLNLAPPPKLTTAQKTILEDGLESIAKLFGYHPSWDGT